MRFPATLVFALATPCLLLAETIAPDSGDAPVIMRPADIGWQPLPPAFEPGGEAAVLAGDPSRPGLVIIRVRLPDGYRIAPHVHPVAEYLTILSGTLCFGFHDDSLSAEEICIDQGTFFVTPANAGHSVRASGPVEYQFSAMGPFDTTYLDPADDPWQRDE